MARGAPKSVYAGKDGDLLKEINDRYDYAFANWDPVRQEGATDTRYVAGNPWEDDERNARLAAGRPVLALDELGQYENQLVNEVRANKRSVKFTPTGNGANDKTAELYQNKFRETEARSRGQIAFTTAFQNMVERSYGWVRLSWRYASPTSLRREIVIDAMPNPDMVTPDPDFQSTTAADMRYCFVEEQRSHDELIAEFGEKVTIRDFGSYTQAHSKWVGQNRVKLAEYWCVEHENGKILRLLLPDKQMHDLLEAEAQPLILQGAQVLKERDTQLPKVTQHLTNGLEILKTTKWEGSYIPIAACLGKILWMAPAESALGAKGRTSGASGPERIIMSMTRLARDPYMLYCYTRTQQAEIVGQTPKIPYFVRRGSLLPKELKALAESLQIPRVVIEVEVDVDGRPVEMPQRNPYHPEIEPLEMLAEAARRAIQAAMAQSPLPTSAQRLNQKSGIALEKITEAAQKGSYHFIDHYEDMLIRVGELDEDLFDKIYSDEDDLAVILPDGTNTTVRVNGQDTPDQPALSTKGQHAVTISTGPAKDSERDAANDFADTLVGNLQMIAQVAGPQVAGQILALSIKLKDLGVLGDQMADLISPPPMKDGEQPTPEQIQQTLQKMQGVVQQMEQEKAQMLKALETEQVKEQAQTERTALQEQNKLEIADRANAKDVEIAKMRAEVEFAIEQLRLQSKQTLQDDQQSADAAMAAADAAVAVEEREDTQKHLVAMAAADAAHEHEQGEMAHERALEQGAAAHEQSMETGEQSHAQSLEAGEAGHEQNLEAIKATPKPKAKE